MTSVPGDDQAAGTPVILVPEVRDFVRINAEIVGLLNEGHRRVRLEGAEGQRLLAAGLVGPWQAIIEVEGRTGPEFAANLDAPGLQIVARGSTLDGAGRGLKAGTVLILGNAVDGLGAAQTGGTLILAGDAGHRAGLNQAGGVLLVLGAIGRLAGDRQSGGCFFLGQGPVGPHVGRGQTGGRRVEWLDPLGPAEFAHWDRCAAASSPWVDRARFDRRPASTCPPVP